VFLEQSILKKLRKRKSSGVNFLIVILQIHLFQLLIVKIVTELVTINNEFSKLITILRVPVLGALKFIEASLEQSMKPIWPKKV
jgi:hypothetical protein